MIKFQELFISDFETFVVYIKGMHIEKVPNEFLSLKQVLLDIPKQYVGQIKINGKNILN